MQVYRSPNELYHYGVLGMKWGVRRYQNKDGTRTAAGKKRHAKSSKTSIRRTFNKFKSGVSRGIADRKTITEDSVQRGSKVYNIGSSVGYSISAIGSVAGLIAKSAAIATGATLVGNVIVAGATIAALSSYVPYGIEYVQKIRG